MVIRRSHGATAYDALDVGALCGLFPRGLARLRFAAVTLARDPSIGAKGEVTSCFLIAALDRVTASNACS
jgi:hypothetical protein